MLKKTVTYKDLFTDEEISEDFYFHLSKAELVEMEVSYEGGLSEALQRIVAAEDGKSIIAEFKNIILSAYGKRSEDGKRFVKNATVREEFESTEAYSTLFIELVTDADAATEFINGIIPNDLEELTTKITRADLEVVQDKPEVMIVDKILKPEPKIVFRSDIRQMDVEQLEELRAGIVSGEIKISEE